MDREKELTDYLCDQTQQEIDREILRYLGMSKAHRRPFESVLMDIICDNPGISYEEAEALAAMILVEEA